MKKTNELIKTKKVLIFQLLILLAFVTGLASPQNLDASSSPDGTTTITETATYNGFDVKLTYPSKIFEGEDLPLTVRLLDANGMMDSISRIVPDYHEKDEMGILPKTVSISSFHSSGYLYEGDTADYPYHYDTADLSEGSHSFRFAGFKYHGSSNGTVNDLNISIDFEVVGSDTTDPVLEGNGVYYADVDNPVTLNDIKATLTATDETDGDITSDIVNVSDNYTSNSDTLGDYSTVWEVEDAAGNSAQTTVTVRVVDIDKPIINLNGSSSMTLEVDETYDEPGASVSDNYDTDLTADISGTVDTSTVGAYTVTYNATDSSGNEADTVTRTVNVVDTTAPVISLTGDSTMYIEVGGTYSEPGASVSDNYDTDLTADISGTVDTSSLGTYTVTYNATDSEGNDANTVTRTVIVRDTTKPVIELDGDDTVYVEFGQNYEEPGATVTDNYDSSIEVVITGEVDESELGTYTITYNATDSSDNDADTVTRTVIVRDTTNPSIIGSNKVVFNSQDVSFNTLLSEFNATDMHDGDITADIVVVSENYSGNETTVGSYTVTLSVEDSNGNATESTFTIEVKDDIPPVFNFSSYLLTEEQADSMTIDEIRDHILSR